MQLIYLYIENYKNIKNQGFNFTPQYHCTFDGNALTIKENRNYVDIFPENINVTALVGKNGSGKSSVFEIISDMILEREINNRIIFVYYDNNIKLITNIEYIRYDIEKFEIKNKIQDIYSVYYSSSFTNGSLIDTYDLFATSLYKVLNTDIDKKEYSNYNVKNQSLLNLFFNSSRLISTHKADSGYYMKDAFTIKDMIQEYEIGKAIVILNFLRLFDKNYLPIDVQFIDTIEISLNNKINSMNGKNYRDIFHEYFKLYTEDSFIGHDYEDYIASIDKEKYVDAISKLINFLKIHNFEETEKYESIYLSLDDALIFIGLYMDVFRLNQKLEKSIINIKFPNLSNGEENLILMFALLETGITSFYIKDKSEKYNIVLMLDEVENNLHPQWQKQILQKLIKYLQLINQNVYKNRLNYHIIFTTHSPFLLSDIPKENIIFLDNGKNVSDTIDINTFGANIHTLLAHGFFMEDGLMGKFAKNKIQKAIDFLNDKNNILTKDEVWNIIQKIGEPFLKMKLEEMYSKRFKNDTHVMDKIKELKSNIKRLEND